MRKRAGFSLMEAMLYGFLSLLAIGLLLTLLRDGRRLFGHTTATFLVDRAFDRALVLLRGDLAETSLSSIRVYPAGPGSDGDKEVPGLTLAGSGSEVTREGVPRWKEHVFYSLQGEAGALTGTLQRWRVPLENPGGIPSPNLMLPSLARPAVGVETVLRDVQMPATSIPKIDESRVGPRGGFQVTFVRRRAGKEILSPWNPCEVSVGRGEKDIEGNTSLIDLELRVFRPADSVSASQYAVVRCRLCPRTVP